MSQVCAPYKSMTFTDGPASGKQGAALGCPTPVRKGNTLQGFKEVRTENGLSKGQNMAWTGLIVSSSLDREDVAHCSHILLHHASGEQGVALGTSTPKAIKSPVFYCLDVYHMSPDSGQRQYKSRVMKRRLNPIETGPP